jgi:3-phosphoglycerate kinase
MKNIKQLKNISGKKVLVRVDFNIPIRKGKVVSDYKLVKSLPTIEYLLKNDAVVILVSHLGRPSGKDVKLSLKPVAKRLEELLQKKVAFINFSLGKNVANIRSLISAFSGGSVVMLENIRFLKEEEQESVLLSKALAGLCDIFVLDGFAVSHRRAASVTGVARYVPSYAGLLLNEEISVLSDVTRRPKHPLTVVLGGAKTETKIPILRKFLPIADHILVGGGIVNTYLFAIGKSVGSSIINKKLAKEVKKYCSNKKVILPVDVVVGNEGGTQVKIVKIEDLKVAKNEAIYDIGPATVRLYAEYLKKSRTLIWNGALGRFEQPPYQYGTFSLARLFAARSKGRATGVCGGGETVEILEVLKIMSEIDLVSTGGGAMLEYLAGEKLPGLQLLK